MNGGSPSPVSVLLVDDDQEDYLITRALLEEIGRDRFRLDWVPAYDAAVRAIRRQNHDVCLLDYALGARTGLELIEEVVSDGCCLPIIFLTGNGCDGIEQKALAAGAADFLVKGRIDPVLLQRSIRHSIERGRTLAALRDRELQLRAVFDNALDAMLVADDDGRYVDGNPAALELLGVSHAQLLTMAHTDVVPAEARSATSAAWRALLGAGRHEGELQIAGPAGDLRTVEYRATANIRPGRHLSVLRDVTDRRRAEEVRVRLAAIVESTDDGIDGASLDGVIDYWSASAERIYGYAAREVIGNSLSMLFPPDASGELQAMLRKLRRGETFRNFETVRRRKDGTSFDVSVTVSPVRRDGRIVGISSVTRDISERKQLQARLAVADRMASVGVLAAGLGHEINNPLAAAIANLDFLAQEVEELESTIPPASVLALRDPLEDARAAADRIRQVVKDLRLFARPDDKRGPVDVQRVMESSLRMAMNEVRHRAVVVREFGQVGPVEANEARLGQVFLNLLVNAAQSIPEGRADHNEVRITTRTDEQARVVVEVRDTGAGIAPAELTRIFEPFFTTKPVGIGTGLGLSICEGIVHEIGGELTVESEVGVGTCFRVVLRPARGHLAPELRLRSSATSSRRGKVLIVDDEPMVLRAVQRWLSGVHDVSVTTSARDAIDLLASGAEYDVILCDLMMPQMTGMDLHAELSREFPRHAERMIFFSGGAFTPGARTFLDAVTNPRLEKPVDGHELRELIAELVA